jgi:hypothetical protein
VQPTIVQLETWLASSTGLPDIVNFALLVSGFT